MKTAWITLALALAACDSTSLPSEPDSKTTVNVTIRGTVLADNVGSIPSEAKPLSGVQVWITSAPTLISPEKTHATTTSRTNGEFELRFEVSRLIRSCSYYALHASGRGHVGGSQDFGQGDCEGVVRGVMIHVVPLVTPESTLTFLSQPAATSEECLARPPGTICLGFNDDYVWLVQPPSPIRGNRSGGMYQGLPVAVVIFDGLELHHVMGTDLVAEARF